jgi:beta-phosphoglucomutase-like phosphatase (HAD superfamily)
MKFPEQIKNIEAVILDMDGVLVDTEHLHMKAFEIFLQKYGLKVEKDFLLSLIGTSIEDNFKMFSDRFSFFKDNDVQPFIRERNTMYLEILQKEPLEPLSGVIEILDYCLNNDIKTGLASSSDKEQIDLILKKLNSNKNYDFDLFNTFNTIVAGDSVKEKKPAADIYLKAVSDLKVVKNHVVAIEDSQAGIFSAKSAGIFCFALENYYNDVYRMKGPDYIIKTLHDFVEILFEM